VRPSRPSRTKRTLRLVARPGSDIHGVRVRCHADRAFQPMYGIERSSRTCATRWRIDVCIGY
jgi:hypothetical protein